MSWSWAPTQQFYYPSDNTRQHHNTNTAHQHPRSQWHHQNQFQMPRYEANQNQRQFQPSFLASGSYTYGPERVQSAHNQYAGNNSSQNARIDFNPGQTMRTNYGPGQRGRYTLSRGNQNCGNWLGNAEVNPTLSLYQREFARGNTGSASRQTGQNVDLARTVTMQKNPFFDIEATLLEAKIVKHSTDQMQLCFDFELNPEQVESLLSDERYQVQLRCCKLDTMREQPDYFPSSLQVAVNMKVLHLPGIHNVPKTPATSIDITRQCHLRDNKSNEIHVRTMEECKMFVILVKKLDSQELLKILQSKPQLEPKITSKKIEEKLSQDSSIDEIAPTTLRCSLQCPISRTRLQLPCRPSTCKHFQCFDAGTYIQMNEKKPKWVCPVCSETALYKDLQIDGYFIKVLKDNASDEKIELLANGSWKPLNEVVQDLEQVPECHDKGGVEENTPVATVEKTINLASDDEDDAEADNDAECDEPLSATIETITLSDDEVSDSEEMQTLKENYVLCSTPVSAHSRLPSRGIDSEVMQSWYSKNISNGSFTSPSSTRNNSTGEFDDSSVNQTEDASDGSFLSLTVSSIGDSPPHPTTRILRSSSRKSQEE